MSRPRVFFPVLALCLACASCVARLPQAEVDAANIAFAEALNARADLLSPASFEPARAANDALQANLNAKEYGKTKAIAKALAEASGKAAADASLGLESAKAEVAQLGADIVLEIAGLQKVYAKASRGDAAARAKVDFKAIKAGLAASSTSLADAQALADVLAAKAQLAALKAALDGYGKEFAAAGFRE